MSALTARPHSDGGANGGLRRLSLLILPLLLIFSLVACADSESDEVAMEKVFATKLNAYNTGDGSKAYDTLSSACRRQVPRDEFNAGIRLAHEALGGGRLQVGNFGVAQKSGDQAIVVQQIAAFGVPNSLRLPTDPREERLVKEGGKWRTTNCSGGIG